MEIKDRIRKRLSTLKPRRLAAGYTREAAVLMPIFKRGNEYHFLLTRRTEEVQTHKGQISFPGGMREGKENLLKTALRETYEEVGIEEKSVENLGRFHDYLSINGFRVTPFAGFISEPFATIRQVREVAEILQVPFDIFMDPSRFRIERQIRHNRETDVYFYSHGTHEIWGLTALIIKDFFDALKLTL